MKHLILFFLFLALPAVAQVTGVALDRYEVDNGVTEFTEARVPTLASSLLGFDAAGAPGTITLGSGLSLSGGVLTATGGGGGSGTVTSVALSGGTTGLTATGSPVTTSGTITLGGTLAVANGGTGATTAAAARTALGLVIGTDVQAYSASATLLGNTIDLASEITGTLPVANGGTGATTASGARTALGLVIGTDVQAYSASATLLGNTIDLASEITGTLPVANGGTGATTASGARTALGLVIGTDVQSYNGDTTLLGNTIDLASEITGTLPLANGGTGAALTDPGADRLLFWDESANALTWLTPGSGLAITGTTLDVTAGGTGTVTSVALSGGTTGLTATGSPVTTSGTITLGGTLAVANGGTGAATASGARTALGLVIGTDVQAYSASATLLGSTIDLASEITGTLPVANGGTGATTAAAARTALGLVIGTDVQAYSNDTTLLGNTIDLASEITGTLPKANGGTGGSGIPDAIVIACSDETTAATAGTGKVTFRMPFAATLTGVRLSLTTAPTGSTFIVDINEAGSSVLSTKLTVDATEATSTTAATAAVISDSALADDAQITVDFDQVGSSTAGAGVKVTLFITR